MVLSFFNQLLPSEDYRALLIPYFALWVVYAIRLSGFRCPRCGKPFSRTWWFSTGGLNLYCLHGGLKEFNDRCEESGGDCTGLI